jgi:hypothetical protein
MRFDYFGRRTGSFVPVEQTPGRASAQPKNSGLLRVRIITRSHQRFAYLCELQGLFLFWLQSEADARVALAALSPVLSHGFQYLAPSAQSVPKLRNGCSKALTQLSLKGAPRDQFNRRTSVEDGPKDFKTAAKGVSYCAERTFLVTS